MFNRCVKLWVWELNQFWTQAFLLSKTYYGSEHIGTFTWAHIMVQNWRVWDYRAVSRSYCPQNNHEWSKFPPNSPSRLTSRPLLCNSKPISLGQARQTTGGLLSQSISRCTNQIQDVITHCRFCWSLYLDRVKSISSSLDITFNCVRTISSRLHITLDWVRPVSSSLNTTLRCISCWCLIQQDVNNYKFLELRMSISMLMGATIAVTAASTAKMAENFMVKMKWSWCCRRNKVSEVGCAKLRFKWGLSRV